MNDLRAILGDKYDATIEKVLEAIAGEVDYLGCGCCTDYGYNDATRWRRAGEAMHRRQQELERARRLAEQIGGRR